MLEKEMILKNLSTRQLAVAHLLLRGKTEEEVLKELRMAPEDLSEMIALPDFQVYIQDFELEVRQRILKSSTDVREMLDAASVLCTRVLAMAATQGMVGEDRITSSMQIKTAQDLMDRAGFSAVRTSQTNNGIAINIGGDVAGVVDAYEKRKALENAR